MDPSRTRAAVVLAGLALALAAARPARAPGLARVPALPIVPELVPVGVSKVDVTPEFPVRLCGYAARTREAEGVAQHLFARALAIGAGESSALLIAIDNAAVPAWIVEELARRLREKRGLARERFTVCSTHTHTGPCLTGSIELMFGAPIPDEQVAHIDAYTQGFLERVVAAGLQALDDRRPATLQWSEGRASFAKNRRTANGPVDRSLPMLAALAPDGTLRATITNYACHCTTLGPETNQHCGDWAGFASEEIEAAHAGAVALTVIGCGGDANPEPRTGMQYSKDHGRAIATEVERLLAGPMQPLAAPPSCALKRLDLPYDKPPTRAELEERAKKNDAVAYHAKHWLAKLDRGEAMPATLPYVVQTWIWGDSLAQVFLAGEVVVDYDLRLKRELDRKRLWVSAYSNDVPCYIPSRRILSEGGYEAEGAMTYYGRPTRLAPAVEDLIVGAVRELVPARFASDEQARRFPPPKSPQESLACLHVNRESDRRVRTADGREEIRNVPAFDVELIASEPMIESPVAIDFGADGTVWVCEMNDYPSGMRGHFEPGGRVKWLKDRDGDGVYESSGVFLDDLPFPTGVMAWRKGVLICAAPDILYAEDTDGDGKADVRKVLFTGFSTENYQARVNSLTWGLDGWVYGSCGLFGGIVKRGDGVGEPIDCRGRDFRMDPDTLAFEPIEGTSQQGRVRDDFGHWFGCDSGTLIFQFPMADRYVKRNPFVHAPNPRANILADEDPRQLFPTSNPLERFNDQGDLNRVTSACGVCIYRDDVLGSSVQGNAFCCEPVSNLVRRIVLDRDGVPLRGHRASEELDREFLTSDDNWFRPVQAITGPDGALWIVDMYRFVIEHPRWIPADKLAELDVRAGADKGRIYRVVPKGRKLRSVQDLTRLDPLLLVEALDTPNGTVRDLVHRELVQRRDSITKLDLDEIESALDLLVKSKRAIDPAICISALHVLDGIGRMHGAATVIAAFQEDPRIRSDCIRLTESARDEDFSGVGPAFLFGDVDSCVRFQIALSLGEWNDWSAVGMLGRLLVEDLEDSWIRAAVLSSSRVHPDAILAELLKEPRDVPEWRETVSQLVATAVGGGSVSVYAGTLEAIAPHSDAEAGEPWRWTALGELEQALRRRGGTDAGSTDWKRLAESAARIGRAQAAAEAALRSTTDSIARGASVKIEPALAALKLLPAWTSGEERAVPEHLTLCARLLDPHAPLELQQAAVAAITRIGDPDVPQFLLHSLSTSTPTLRGVLLDALIARKPWLDALVGSLERREIPAVVLDAAHRDRLLRTVDAGSKETLEKLLAAGGRRSRAEVVSAFKPALDLKGDTAKGAPTFARLCAQCHLFRGQGHEVGPDLAAIGDKSSGNLLQSILDPNAAVNGDFVAYDVELKDGELLCGLIRGETSTGFTLVMPNDVRRTLLRSEVAEVNASRLSLMPEALEQDLAPQDVADLIAYVQTAPTPLDRVTEEQAKAARQRFLAGGCNGFARIVSSYDVFTQPSWLGACTMYYCRQSDGSGKVVWQSAPAPAASSSSTVTFRFAAAVGFKSQPKGEFALSMNGRPLLQFDVVTDDASFSSADGRSTLRYTVLAANREDSTGVMELDVPSSLIAAGKAATFEVTGSAAGGQRWFGVLVCPSD